VLRNIYALVSGSVASSSHELAFPDGHSTLGCLL
jgi:hypothetical protein